MNSGESLTRLAIWLALGAYAIGAATLLRARGRDRWLRRARWVWTFGCALFVAHVAAAFTYYHHWSHAAAYRETARQTAAFIGWPSGAGLFLNYFFGIAWLADVLWWWTAPAHWSRRPAWLSRLWHGFAFFMVLNGAVIFAHGPMRWLGLALCLLLAALWGRERLARQRRH